MAQKFISLTFDDGWKSAIVNAQPLLARYEMPAMFYIISDRIDEKHTEYMNAPDIQMLQGQGHEIGVHTRSHQHLPDLPDAEVWDEITQGLDDLLKLGVQPRTFAYPFGEWNPYVVKQVREAGFFAARSIERGINDEKVNPFLLRALAVREVHSVEDVTPWISDFIHGEGKWLILYFHQIESAEILKQREWIYGTTPTVLEGILKFIKEQGISVLTLEKGMEELVRGQH